MTLLTIRTAIRDKGGRFDLVNSDYSDNGADYFINAGQKYLDGKFERGHVEARHFIRIASGAHAVMFADARSVREVYAAKALEDEARYKLERVDLDYIRTNYYKIPAGTSSGYPLYWTPGIIRMSPAQYKVAIQNAGAIIGFADVAIKDGYSRHGIIFAPPADDSYMLELIGMFASPTLVADADESFWTTRYPSLLFMAAMREIEIYHRNTQGVNDWSAAIAEMIRDIDSDVVDHNTHHIEEMEG